jgi:hypothetical protein
MGILAGQQDSDSLLRNSSYTAKNLLNQPGGKSQRWLIEQKQEGLSHQTSTDGAHLLLAAG